MDTTSIAERIFQLCSQNVLLRPIATLLRFLHPLIIARKALNSHEVLLV